MILALRTDRPEAELYILQSSGEIINSETWHAHRELSSTLLIKIEALLKANNIHKNQLTGIVIYRGPGSFTGLRIGATAANAIAYSLNLPIAGAEGEDWLSLAIQRLKGAAACYGEPVTPLYGQEAHITQPRK